MYDNQELTIILDATYKHQLPLTLAYFWKDLIEIDEIFM